MRSKKTDVDRPQLLNDSRVSRSAIAWTLAAFFIKAGLVYAILILPWLGTEQFYAAAYRGCANVFFRSIGGSGRVYFTPNANHSQNEETTVTIQNLRVPGPRASFDLDTRTMGYLATAFLVSLVLATPLPWKRRLMALGIGLALISLFAGLQLYLKLVEILSEKSPLAVYSLSPAVRSLVINCGKVLTKTPVTMYVAPVLVWILVSFRRSDLARLVQPMASQTAAPSGNPARTSP